MKLGTSLSITRPQQRRNAGGPPAFNPELFGNLRFWGKTDDLDLGGLGASWANSAAAGGSLAKLGNVNLEVGEVSGHKEIQFPPGNTGTDSGYFSGNLGSIGSGGMHAFLVCTPFQSDTIDQPFFVSGSGSELWAYFGSPSYKLKEPSLGTDAQGNDPAISPSAVRRLVEFVWKSSNEIQFFENAIERTDGGSPPASGSGSIPGGNFLMGTDGTFGTPLYGSKWSLSQFLFYAGDCSDPAAVREHLMTQYGLV